MEQCRPWSDDTADIGCSWSVYWSHIDRCRCQWRNIQKSFTKRKWEIDRTWWIDFFSIKRYCNENLLKENIKLKKIVCHFPRIKSQRTCYFYIWYNCPENNLKITQYRNSNQINYWYSSWFIFFFTKWIKILVSPMNTPWGHICPN
jgi:hypothetical protein